MFPLRQRRANSPHNYLGDKMSDNPLARFAPMHVLIVEDDLFLAELSADHYRGLGFSVEIAADGKKALAAMEARLPDVVLCDRRMPEMSGAALLETVRARDAAWQKVAFVFVTGLTDHRDRFAMLDLHPDGYLCKPIDFAVADVDLARILEKKRAA
jgi:DNA-binding response OmpR family regulator